MNITFNQGQGSTSPQSPLRDPTPFASPAQDNSRSPLTAAASMHSSSQIPGCGLAQEGEPGPCIPNHHAGSWEVVRTPCHDFLILLLLWAHSRPGPTTLLSLIQIQFTLKRHAAWLVHTLCAGSMPMGNVTPVGTEEFPREQTVARAWKLCNPQSALRGRNCQDPESPESRCRPPR